MPDSSPWSLQHVSWGAPRFCLWLAVSKLAAVLLLIPLAGRGLEFSNGPDGIAESSWRFEGSVLECNLTHSVPFYGRGVFKTRAGESARFWVHQDIARFAAGKAWLWLKPPAWRHNLEPINLGYVPVKQGKTPLVLEARFAERLMTELYTGYAVELIRQPWYRAEQPTELLLSPIGFQAVYQRYQACLGQLLPANFDQIKRTAFYFGSNKHQPLPENQLYKLDNILAFYALDSSISHFYIDAHTDSVGTRADNYVLSEQRAKEVARYLEVAGVPAEKMIIRWHGERYPVANNGSAAGRSKNRRVTIRLDRLPIASSKVPDAAATPQAPSSSSSAASEPSSPPQ
jgi:sodium-type flagellar protein MotY